MQVSTQVGPHMRVSASKGHLVIIWLYDPGKRSTFKKNMPFLLTLLQDQDHVQIRKIAIPHRNQRQTNISCIEA